MRNIPTVTRNLLIINTLCYLVTVALEMVGIDLTNMFGLHFMLAHNFWFFQLFTYMFMHGDRADMGRPPLLGLLSYVRHWCWTVSRGGTAGPLLYADER